MEYTKRNYKLIAFDMDGTLLDSEKKISKGCVTAIRKAVKAGKIVIFNTGRCPAELDDYREILPEVRYLNCISGALVYDLGDETTPASVIASSEIDRETVRKILDIASLEDCMPQILNTDSYCQTHQIFMMEKYGMAVYQPMYEKIVVRVENLKDAYEKALFPVLKMNLYHTDTAARERTRQRVLDAGLKVQLAYAEKTSLEISPEHVHKGTGLLKLCEALGIDIADTIAVGDADNDLMALKTAGLAVAMGNANDNIKNIADVCVSDNDHDGAAEAIYQYLLHD